LVELKVSIIADYKLLLFYTLQPLTIK